MKEAKYRNANGELITMPQAREITNLCESTVRRLAKESGAARKIGNSYRIKKSVLLDYIDERYS